MTALSGLSYCSDGPICRGFCTGDATTQDAADEPNAPPIGFADAMGFYAPDADDASSG